MIRALSPMLVAAGVALMAPLAQAKKAAPRGVDSKARANGIGITLSGSARNQRDENFNDTRYAGGLGKFGLGYVRHGELDRHHVDLSGGAGLGANRYDRTLLWIDLSLRYAYQHVVAGEGLRLWLGGSIGGGPGLYQFRDEDADHINWQTGYDLAFRGLADWRKTDPRGRAHAIEVMVELPLIGLASRPPPHVTYNNDKPSFGYLFGRAHHDPRFASWHNVQSVRGSVGWRLRLRPGLEHWLGYAAEFTRVSFPEPVVAWSHTLAYRLDFRFGR
jgi:hypothetical protein